MPTSTAWCSTSAICQLEWRPSPAFGVALCMLALLAAISVVAGEMPAPVAWPLALAALAYGGWLARRYLGQPACRLSWIAGRAPELDGIALQDARLHWRGPLAFLQGRDADGRMRRLAWWPDTLPRTARRELRLTAEVPADTTSTPSMAP
jgi:toxin CptA